MNKDIIKQNFFNIKDFDIDYENDLPVRVLQNAIGFNATNFNNNESLVSLRPNGEGKINIFFEGLLVSKNGIKMKFRTQNVICWGFNFEGKNKGVWIKTVLAFYYITPNPLYVPNFFRISVLFIDFWNICMDLLHSDKDEKLDIKNLKSRLLKKDSNNWKSLIANKIFIFQQAKLAYNPLFETEKTNQKWDKFRMEINRTLFKVKNKVEFKNIPSKLNYKIKLSEYNKLFF
jgi:hypothetical protein